MKAILKLSIILLITTVTNGQSIKVDYDVMINTNDSDLSKKSIYRLEASNNKSLFHNLTKVPKNYIYNDKIVKIDNRKDVDVIWFENSKTDFDYDKIVYTDLKNDSLIFNSNVHTRKIIIKDTYKNIVWDLQEKDSTILGFNCQLAKTTFRGRKYEAFFTSDINTSLGPWKFHGLPGLILSIKSTDDYYSINAIKLQTNKDEIEIRNPFKDSKIYSWNDYLKFTINFLRKQLKVMQSTADIDEGSIRVSEGIEDLGIKKLSF